MLLFLHINALRWDYLYVMKRRKGRLHSFNWQVNYGHYWNTHLCGLFFLYPKNSSVKTRTQIKNIFILREISHWGLRTQITPKSGCLLYSPFITTLIYSNCSASSLYSISNIIFSRLNSYFLFIPPSTKGKLSTLLCHHLCAMYDI